MNMAVDKSSSDVHDNRRRRESSAHDTLSEYELQRLSNIESNNQTLQSLGLLQQATGPSDVDVTQMPSTNNPPNNNRRRSKRQKRGEEVSYGELCESNEESSDHSSIESIYEAQSDSDGSAASESGSTQSRQNQAYYEEKAQKAKAMLPDPQDHTFDRESGSEDDDTPPSDYPDCRLWQTLSTSVDFDIDGVDITWRGDMQLQALRREMGDFEISIDDELGMGGVRRKWGTEEWVSLGGAGPTHKNARWVFIDNESMAAIHRELTMPGKARGLSEPGLWCRQTNKKGTAYTMLPAKVGAGRFIAAVHKVDGAMRTVQIGTRLMWDDAHLLRAALKSGALVNRVDYAVEIPYPYSSNGIEVYQKPLSAKGGKDDDENEEVVWEGDYDGDEDGEIEPPCHYEVQSDTELEGTTANAGQRNYLGQTVSQWYQTFDNQHHMWRWRRCANAARDAHFERVVSEHYGEDGPSPWITRCQRWSEGARPSYAEVHVALNKFTSNIKEYVNIRHFTHHYFDSRREKKKTWGAFKAQVNEASQCINGLLEWIPLAQETNGVCRRIEVSFVDFRATSLQTGQDGSVTEGTLRSFFETFILMVSVHRHAIFGLDSVHIPLDSVVPRAIATLAGLDARVSELDGNQLLGIKDSTGMGALGLRNEITLRASLADLLQSLFHYKAQSEWAHQVLNQVELIQQAANAWASKQQGWRGQSAQPGRNVDVDINDVASASDQCTDADEAPLTIHDVAHLIVYGSRQNGLPVPGWNAKRMTGQAAVLLLQQLSSCRSSRLKADEARLKLYEHLCTCPESEVRQFVGEHLELENRPAQVPTSRHDNLHAEECLEEHQVDDIIQRVLQSGVAN